MSLSTKLMFNYYERPGTLLKCRERSYLMGGSIGRALTGPTALLAPATRELITGQWGQ